MLHFETSAAVLAFNTRSECTYAHKYKYTYIIYTYKTSTTTTTAVVIKQKQAMYSILRRGIACYSEITQGGFCSLLEWQWWMVTCYIPLFNSI